MNPIYDARYFLNKFDAIPDELWTVGIIRHTPGTLYPINNRYCALGHCGVRWCRSTEEGTALARLFINTLDVGVVNINDSELKYNDLGETPKERIMTALILIDAGVILR